MTEAGSSDARQFLAYKYDRPYQFILASFQDFRKQASFIKWSYETAWTSSNEWKRIGSFSTRVAHSVLMKSYSNQTYADNFLSKFWNSILVLFTKENKIYLYTIVTQEQAPFVCKTTHRLAQDYMITETKKRSCLSRPLHVTYLTARNCIEKIAALHLSEARN